MPPHPKKQIITIMIRQSPRSSPRFSPLRGPMSPPPPLPPIDAPPLEDFTLDGSGDDSSSDDEPLTDVMADLRDQMAKLDEASRGIRSQVKGIYKRAKIESIPWMNHPLKGKGAAVRTWFQDHGLSEKPTLNEFFDACFAAAVSVDLESRIITFSKKDAIALWGGEQRITVFDMLSLLPTIFE